MNSKRALFIFLLTVVELLQVLSYMHNCTTKLQGYWKDENFQEKECRLFGNDSKFATRDLTKRFVFYHPVISLKEFVERAGNISIGLLGQSLQLQIFEMIGCAAKREKLDHVVTTQFIRIENRKIIISDYQPQNFSNWYYTIRFKNGFQLVYIRFYTEYDVRFTLYYEYLTHALKHFTYNFLEIGPHYSCMKFNQTFYNYLPYLLPRNDAVIFRESFPTHFASEYGTYENRDITSTNCHPIKNLQFQKDCKKIIRDLVSEYGFGYIYTQHLYEDCWDCHKDPKVDCLHFAYTKSIWEPALQSIYNIILCYLAKPSFSLA